MRYSSEHGEQKALFEWAALKSATTPELKLLHAIPNGGLRDKGTARKLKSEGVKPGVPDIFLPVAMCAFHGLYIEMKVKPNKPTKKQHWWGEQLSIQGYLWVVAYGWQAATDIILKYLGELPWKGISRQKT